MSPPLVDPVTHRLPVRAEIDNRDGALKPEMFANFRILTSDACRIAGRAGSAPWSTKAMPRMCGWWRATDLLSLPRHPHRAQQ